MKIYLAAQFEERNRIRAHASALWELGHDVVSSWLNETTKSPHIPHEAFFAKLARKDLAEIESADMFVLDTATVSQRGGKENEFGYALGRHHKILVAVVGPKRSVFHELCDLHFETWAEFLEHMKQGGTHGL